VLLTAGDVAVVNLGLPVADLLREIEGETGRALDGSQADDTVGAAAIATHHVTTVALRRQTEELFRVPVGAELLHRHRR